MSRRVCIVGAGAAGIATASALSSSGVDFDWFEGGSLPGGLWRYDNDSGLSAVYASLITNTSAPNTTLFGYSLRTLGNDYLTHAQVLSYLESYLDHANLRAHLTPATWVRQVTRTTDSRFRVTTQGPAGDLSTRDYDAVVVATGRNWCPQIPSIHGTFSGLAMHSIRYRTPDLFTGKRVIVVGFGNTGADIAVEATSCAASVILSTRSGGPLKSRYGNGRPADQAKPLWFHLLPLGVRRALASLRRKLRGQQGELGSKPPVINDRIAALIEAGTIALRRGIRAADGNVVTFSDGTGCEADIIVWATGYKSAYPFLSREVLARNANFEDRYYRVVPPDEPGLYFVGQAAVIGPVFPVLEAQARWVADLIAGKCTLPDAARLRRAAQRESAANRKILGEVARGEDTIETYPYVRLLQRLRSR